MLRHGYDLSYDQIVAAALGSEPERCPASRLDRCPQTAKEVSVMTVSPDLDRRFREAAPMLDLVDIGFDVLDSPIGPLFVAASARGLAAISFQSDPEDQLERMARIAGPRKRCARRGRWK